MGSSNSSSGVYIPTTQVWDVTEVHEVDVTKPEFKELLVRMYQNLNSMSMAIGTKESSFYSTLETVKGQAFNPRTTDSSTNTSNPESRQVFNKVIVIAGFVTGAYAHGIPVNAGYTFTRIYGCATNPAGFLAVPVPTTGTTITVDATNVNIVTGLVGYSAHVILEYMKC